MGQRVPQHVVALNQTGVADGLTLAAPGASEQGAARHRFQLRCLGVGDVLAVVATDTDSDHAVEFAIAVACCIEIENVEKASVGHYGVPRNLANRALFAAFKM